MVCARLLAEATVLILLLLLPIFLVIAGKLSHYPPAVQGMFVALAAVALLILPSFGFITWLVTTDTSGMRTNMLCAKKFCQWDQVKALKRRATWNSSRFALEYEGGELTFPALVENCDLLLAEIRSHLPKGPEGIKSAQRTYAYDPIIMLFLVLQSVIGIVFAGIFWVFFASQMHFKSGSLDAPIILLFCTIITIIILWRSWVIAWLPRAIEISESGLVVRTYFRERRLKWPEVLSLGMPLPVLPDGFTIKTTKGTILVGNNMDSADELHDSIQKEISAARLGSAK